MKLKFLIEHTNQSFTLKPEIKYIVGSAQDCTINLPNIDGIAERHIALSFSPMDNAWQVEDLGSANGTFVNGQPITIYKIDAPVRIALAGNFLIAAAPLVADIAPMPAAPIQSIQALDFQPPITPPPVYGSQQSYSPAPVSQSQSVSSPSGYNGYPPVAPTPRQAPTPNQRTNNFSNRSIPRAINWWEFVDRQVEKGHSWLDRVAIRFYMTTGLRKTPYIDLMGGSCLDGYIIPDFKGRAEEIAAGISASLDQLRQYPDTDCSVVWLTDAHLADVEPSPMLGIPIKRANRQDFRRFCVVSHHRIRTYVIVDNYGDDLFVGRITRFEPQLNGFSLALWGAFCLILVLFFTFGSDLPLFYYVFSGGDLRASVFIWSLIIFSGLWSAVFIGAPILMRHSKALPVRTNLSAIIFLMIIILIMFFGFLKLLFPT